jgi:putative DNA primase/helicase
LKRVCGYCLTGFTKEDALFFLYGTGRNGKSVFLRTVAGVVHEYHRAASMETSTVSRGERHPTELAMLRGARTAAGSTKAYRRVDGDRRKRS